jgi:SAM-dependent methyltransferase
MTQGHDHYMLRGGLEAEERLRILGRAMYPTTAALFDRVGIVRGMRCLDVGCGSGAVTRELARRAGPAGRVVGIDIDRTVLELARQDTEREGTSGIEYREGNVMTAALAPEYDAIYARFVLTHMADPAAAASRIAAGLRPGGVLIVEDIDFNGSFCHPPSAAYDRYTELYTKTARARGVDPNIGPCLPQLLVAAGCKRVRMNVVQPAAMRPDGHEGDIKLVTPLTLENIADSSIADGLATSEEIDSVLDELYRLAVDSTTVLALPRIVQTWGYRDAA